MPPPGNAYHDPVQQISSRPVSVFTNIVMTTIAESAKVRDLTVSERQRANKGWSASVWHTEVPLSP